MKIYAYIAIAVIVIGALGIGYTQAYKSGKDSVITKLKDDRVKVLKDGAQIDENVLSIDDDGLLCLLLDNCDNKPL